VFQLSLPSTLGLTRIGQYTKINNENASSHATIDKYIKIPDHFGIILGKIILQNAATLIKTKAMVTVLDALSLRPVCPNATLAIIPIVKTFPSETSFESFKSEA
jgi:hypothetical protein